MGKKLSADKIARRARGRFRAPTRRPGRVLCALMLALLASGCAASATGTASNKDRPHGFYGGVSVGGVVP